MPAEVVIRAQGLGKRYLLGRQVAQQDGSLREAMSRAVRSSGRNLRSLFSGEPGNSRAAVEEFWALKDTDFEIRQGEVVGILGRNGAGKSTLLKILSRITEPTEGCARIRGRVATLLELGTGFHPELTGRENVYLNGAVLGLSRGEIKRRFDEIVAFAGVERFIDVPVKRYSSGMYVRLGFAVAAHLEPEILIVDEVLAVGDAEFQRKCLGKMRDASNDGRTVLFVSHNMAAIEQFCSRALLIENGRLKCDGEVRRAISDYLAGSDEESLEYVPGSDPARVAEIARIALRDQNKGPLKQVTTADAPILEIDIVVRKKRSDLKLAFALYDAVQTAIFASCPLDDGLGYPSEPGTYRFHAVFPWPLFMPQRYSITVALYTESGMNVHSCPHNLVFEVIPAKSQIYSTDPKRAGLLQIPLQWKQVGEAHNEMDAA